MTLGWTVGTAPRAMQDTQARARNLRKSDQSNCARDKWVSSLATATFLQSSNIHQRVPGIEELTFPAGRTITRAHAV